MNEKIAVPESYRRDAQGRLVPEDMIKPIDLERDRLVQHLVDRASELSSELSDFKAVAFGDIEAFIEMSAEEYGAKVGGKKGNVTLLSFDGRFKIVRAVQESISFDERLQAARALIDECLQDWTQGARPEVVTLVNDAFRTDTKGEIRTARVLALRRLEITDKRWQQAMKAIGEACQVIGSKSYIRVYERMGDTDQYKQISLDIAGV
ncbi:sulfate transporter [Pseudomonas sp. WN033]|nr:sulfate transporter [Pseudomonas sp. WN033]